jgi:hypothetical protein
MISIKKRQFLILILILGIGLLTACGEGASALGPEENSTANPQKQEVAAASGLRTATPASNQSAAAADTDPRRWQEVNSFQGNFTFTLEFDLEEVDLATGGLQTVRSIRSGKGMIILQRVDEDTWKGEGTMTWFVDDFFEVSGENGVLIRQATAKGQGETLLNTEETLLWLDLDLGTYGLAIFPAGLYDDMEVSWTEAFVGLETTEEIGPLGYLGLMDTAGIAGWFEDFPLPESGGVLAGILELSDGSVMTWSLQAAP